jgi:hypothetical protein
MADSGAAPLRAGLACEDITTTAVAKPGRSTAPRLGVPKARRDRHLTAARDEQQLSGTRSTDCPFRWKQDSCDVIKDGWTLLHRNGRAFEEWRGATPTLPG